HPWGAPSGLESSSPPPRAGSQDYPARAHRRADRIIEDRTVLPSPCLLSAMRHLYPLMNGTSEGSAYSLFLEETPADRDRMVSRRESSAFFLVLFAVDIPARSLHPYSGGVGVPGDREPCVDLCRYRHDFHC